MGSIFNLLNPLSTPPPKKSTSPKQTGRGHEAKRVEDAVVTLDAEAEWHTLVERAEMSVNRKDDKTMSGDTQSGYHSQTNNQESIEMEVEESRPRIFGDTLHVEGGKDNVESTEVGNAYRRRSSSLLMDILNPVEESTVANTHERVQVSREDISTQSKTPQIDYTSSQPVPRVKNADKSEEMIVDVVGVEEGISTHPNGTTSITTDETDSRTQIIIQSSKSADSQQTIEDPIGNVPPTTDAVPSHTPSPSMKRKYTPESSPDEPLSREVPSQTAQPYVPTNVPTQISVEKPQPPSRAIKKPKKAPIKRPQVAKNKGAINGNKKPGPKPKPKTESVGLDDVHPLAA
jgi:hypothetical protein